MLASRDVSRDTLGCRFASRDTSRDSYSAKNELIMDYPPTTRIEENGVEVAFGEPVAFNSGQAVGLAVVASSQSATLPQMQSKASASWESGSRAHRTSSAPAPVLTSQIAAAPTPCGGQQSQSRQQQQQQGQKLPQQQGQGRESGTETPPLQVEPGTEHSITITQTVRPSVHLSHPTSRSHASFPTAGDSLQPVPPKVVGTCWPKAVASPMLQSRYISAAPPATLPRQGSRQNSLPEGLKTEPWGGFVAPLPSPVNALFPPMEFQFHRTAGASVTKSMWGDELPKEEHSTLPRLPAPPPVTSSSDDRHHSAHALAIGRRGIGEVRSSPRSQENSQIRDNQQVQEDSSQQLEHIRSLAIDLASTVQQLCDMQRKMGHELHDVKLQVNHNSSDLEEVRSSFAQLRGLQRSGARPPPLASAPPSYPAYPAPDDAEVLGHPPTNSMVSSPQLDFRTQIPTQTPQEDLHHEVAIPTPVSQGSTASARNLGYSDTQDLLHNFHGRALEGLGSLHDWTARTLHNFVAGNVTGGNSCCQTSEQKSQRPLTRI